MSIDDDFRIAQARRAATIQRAHAALWDRLLDPARLDATFPRYVEAVTRLVALGHLQAAEDARAYYQAVLEQAGLDVRLPAIEPVRLDPKAVEASLRVTGPVAIKEATAQGGSSAAAVVSAAKAASLAAAKRHVLNGARDTITRLAVADRRALGYARISDGGPCGFCAMLCSRGPVYKADTVTFLSHDGCGCVPRPFFRGDPDGGWTDQARTYRALWDGRKRGEYAYPEDHPNPRLRGKVMSYRAVVRAFHSSTS